MSARVYEVTIVRDLKRPYKPVHLGGFLRWIMQHPDASRHGLGRKTPRRGWKQHFAKYPQRGLAFALRLRNAILAARKAAREKA